MKTANERLFDLSIRHQVQVLRFQRSSARRIIELIAQVDAELEIVLQARISKLSALDRRRLGDKGTFTTQRLKALRKALRTTEERSREIIAGAMVDELSELAVFERDAQLKHLRAILAGASLDVITPEARILNSIVSTRPLDGRLLKNIAKQWSADKVGKVEAEIRKGMAAAESSRQIARRINRVHKTKRVHAEAIARTAVTSVTQHARDEVAKSNSDIVKGVRWVSTLDRRTSSICSSRDGKIYKVGQGPRPPAHINCRSVTVLVTKSFRELGLDIDEVPEGTRAALDGKAPASTNYPKWFGGQPRKVQREILGPTRLKVYDEFLKDPSKFDGNPFDRFVDGRTGQNWTLPELQRRNENLFDELDLEFV